MAFLYWLFGPAIDLAIEFHPEFLNHPGWLIVGSIWTFSAVLLGALWVWSSGLVSRNAWTGRHWFGRVPSPQDLAVLGPDLASLPPESANPTPEPASLVAKATEEEPKLRHIYTGWGYPGFRVPKNHQPPAN